MPCCMTNGERPVRCDLSSGVEREAVNFLVLGSNPRGYAMLLYNVSEAALLKIGEIEFNSQYETVISKYHNVIWVQALCLESVG